MDYRTVVSLQEKRLNVLLNFGLFSCNDTLLTENFKWLFFKFTVLQFLYCGFFLKGGCSRWRTRGCTSLPLKLKRR